MTHTTAQVGTPERHGQSWLVPSAAGARTYTVQQNFWQRWECDCDDFWYRQRKTREPCKHITAVLARMDEGSAA
jgi:hypothetical protein